jgi:hypothetical protein
MRHLLGKHLQLVAYLQLFISTIKCRVQLDLHRLTSLPRIKTKIMETWNLSILSKQLERPN